MEWLIYNGIEAYRAMMQSTAKNIDFKARVDEETTRKLLGTHTDTVTYILPKLVERAYKRRMKILSELGSLMN